MHVGAIWAKTRFSAKYTYQRCMTTLNFEKKYHSKIIGLTQLRY